LSIFCCLIRLALPCLCVGMAPCYSCASQDLDRSTRLHRRGQMSDGSFMAEFPRGVSVWTLMRHHDIAPAYFDEHACTQCGWTTGISRCNWCNAALCEWHRRMSDQARRKGAHVKGGSTCMCTDDEACWSRCMDITNRVRNRR